MIRDVASKRYAEAAHLIARENGTEEAWSDGVRAMSALYSDPDAQPVIQTNMILGLAFAEAIGIYALVVAIMIGFVF